MFEKTADDGERELDLQGRLEHTGPLGQVRNLAAAIRSFYESLPATGGIANDYRPKLRFRPY